MQIRAIGTLPICIAISFARVGLADVSSEDSQPAQTSSASESTRVKSLEEVIVTATKRQQRLQDVPFGVSAFTTKDIERMGAISEADFLADIPGVHFNGAGARGRSQIVIRGVSTVAVNTQNEQRTVEKYLDELPLTDRFSSWSDPDISTFDVERIEVLRGPQGTLFGSGAMGGVVRLVTNKPNATEFQAKFEVGQAATRGGDNSNNVGAMVNVPLAQDKLAMRAVGYYTKSGGYVDNVHRQEKNVDEATTEGGRLMFSYQPTDALQFGLNALYDHAIADDSSATFTSDLAGASDEWRGVIPSDSDAKVSIYNLTINYDFPAATLTSVTTYGERDSTMSTDAIRGLDAFFGTGLDPNNNAAWITHDSQRLAQEIRLASSTAGRLQWTVGGFFMDFDQDLRQILDLGPQHLLFLDDTIAVESKESALFGEATYRFNDRWSVTAGARWFRGEFGIQLVSAPAAAIQQSTPFVEDESTSVTPRVSISYFPREDLHFYATASEGYRIGQANFNHGLAPEVIPVAHGPDSLWSYETGMKSSWLGGRLQTNLAVYYIDWSDIVLQRNVTTPGGIPWSFQDNAGEATIKGAEVELTVSPTDAIEFGTALAYNDGELQSVKAGVTALPDSTLPGTPEFAASTYAQGMATLNGELGGYLRLSHRYVGEVYGDINNEAPNTVSDSYNVYDVRAGLTYRQYEVSLFVDNVLDNDAATARAGLFFETLAYRLRPRTIGLTVRASF